MNEGNTGTWVMACVGLDGGNGGVGAATAEDEIVVGLARVDAVIVVADDAVVRGGMVVAFLVVVVG